MGLLGNGFDITEPPFSQAPTLGDDKIREIKAKLQAWVNVEHSGETGYHTFPKVASLPANDANSRRFVIKDNSGIGKADELYYDNGSSWIKITTNQDVLDHANDLNTHKAASPIDHPDSSVTRDKIAAGAIVKKHLVGGTDNSSVADLFNGSSNGDNFHTHINQGNFSVLNSQTFTSSGTYIPPAACKYIVAKVWSAGGNGGTAISGGGGGGGGGGAYGAVLILNLGIASLGYTVGGNGVSSSIDGYLSCTAGANGVGATRGNGGVASDLGAFLTLRIVSSPGGAGGLAYNGVPYGSGGGGCGSPVAAADGTTGPYASGAAGANGGGNGGNGGGTTLPGSPGVFPGGGGGGGSDGQVGGLGAAAKIEITAWG